MGFLPDCVEEKVWDRALVPAWEWIRENPLLFAFAAFSTTLLVDTALQYPVYFPTAGPQRLLGWDCSRPSKAVGEFNTDRRSFEEGRWQPFDATPSSAVPHGWKTNALLVHAASAPLRASNGALKWPVTMGGIERNSQFPRIQLQIPPEWHGREIRMKATLGWSGIKPLEQPFPATVAVNVKVKHPQWLEEKYIVLLGEAVGDKPMTVEEFLPFRLPEGTEDAWIRIGLHGVHGSLFVDDVSFQICR